MCECRQVEQGHVIHKFFWTSLLYWSVLKTQVCVFFCHKIIHSQIFFLECSPFGDKIVTTNSTVKTVTSRSAPQLKEPKHLSAGGPLLHSPPLSLSMFPVQLSAHCHIEAQCQRKEKKNWLKLKTQLHAVAHKDQTWHCFEKGTEFQIKSS